MIDGCGQVLITDFGLAGLAADMEGAEIRNGTPAYMTPVETCFDRKQRIAVARRRA